jgi:hypothetical protein
MRNLLSRDIVLEGLRQVDRARLKVEWAILFGSLAKRSVGRNVDLLVKPKDRGGVE